MTDKKLPVHMIFTGVYFLLALLTLMPNGAAGKSCLLGYEALCSFTPISTVLLLVAGTLHIYLHNKKPAAKKAETAKPGK